MTISATTEDLTPAEVQAIYAPYGTSTILGAESSNNPDSSLGFARSYLSGLSGDSFKQEAISLIAAVPLSGDYSGPELRRAEQVLRRLSVMQ